VVFSIEQFLAPIIYRQKDRPEYLKKDRIPLKSSFFQQDAGVIKTARPYPQARKTINRRERRERREKTEIKKLCDLCGPGGKETQKPLK
jgi:hypothetical protein